MTYQEESVRFHSIDILRGLAMILMVVFHFFFDLSFLGLISLDFYNDPFWLHARTFIVTMFLTLVGVSFVLHNQSGFSYRKFFLRQRNLLFCVLLISVSTYFVSKDRFIFFGILHFIFVASFLNLFFIRHFHINLFLGVLLILIGNFFSNEVFHNSYLIWIGFQEFKPATDDYVPLLPWYGVVLIGIFLGKILTDKTDLLSRIEQLFCLGKAGQLIGLMGRHGLMVYMIHQPILLAILYFYLYLKS